MNPDDVVLVAVKSRVMAIHSNTGEALWSTQLPGTLGDPFVTLLSDGHRVFAHTRGCLHCIDYASGSVLWSNDLPGCGYGFASLALPRGASAPDAVLLRAVVAARSASSDVAPPSASQ